MAQATGVAIASCGALILAPIMLVVVECLDLLTLMDEGTVCGPGFIVDRVRRLATVIVAGSGGAVFVILAGGVDAGRRPVTVVFAVGAAAGALVASVRGWTRSAAGRRKLLPLTHASGLDEHERSRRLWG